MKKVKKGEWNYAIKLAAFVCITIVALVVCICIGALIANKILNDGKF